MLLTAPAYSTENAKLSRTPIYRVEFVRGLNSVGKFSTLPVRDDPECLPYIQEVRGLGGQVEPERGRTSVGSIVIVIADIGQEITRLISGVGIGGDVLTFQKGFEAIADTDFQTLLTGRVDSCRLTSDLGAYEITIRDPQLLLQRPVFEVSSTLLSIDLAAGETTEMFVDDASGFRDTGTIRISGSGGSDEYLTYAAKTPTSLTGLVRGVSPGSAVTVDGDHAAGDTVQEILWLGPAHPIDQRVAILVNTDKSGLSIDPALVDTVTHDAIKASIGPDLLMEWLIDASAPNAKDWIEAEIDSKLGLYGRTTGDGKISLVNSIVPGAPVAAIDTNNTLTEEGGGQVLSWDQNLGSVINVVTTYYDNDAIAGLFKNTLEITDAASILKFGRRPLVMESKGFRSTLAGTIDFITEISNRILNRYSNGAPIVTASAFLREHLIEPGDVVSLTSPVLPNIETGARGVNEALLEVIQRNIAFDTGRTELTMQWAQVCFQWLTDWNDPGAAESLASIAQDNTFFYIGTGKGPGGSSPSIGRFSRRSGTIVDALEIPRSWDDGTATVISMVVDSDYIYALVNEYDGVSQSQVTLWWITHATFTSADPTAEQANWHSITLLQDLSGPGYVSAGQLKLDGDFFYAITDANDGNSTTFFRVAKDRSSVEFFPLATFQTKRFTVDDLNGFLYATGNWGDETGSEFTIVRATLGTVMVPDFDYDTRLKVDTTDSSGVLDPERLPIDDDPDFLYVAYLGAQIGLAKVDKPTFTLDSLQALAL